MDFKARLREEISFSGLSNKEVAAQAGITLRALVSYVSGQSCMPSAEVAVRLAKVLKTSVEYLMTGKNPDELQGRSTEDSRKLSHIYASLPDEQKKLLLAVAEDIAKCLK